MTDIEPVPAATVVLIRENPGSKNLKCFWCSVIQAGVPWRHWVFPGGRLDDEDFGDDESRRLEYPAALRAAVGKPAKSRD